MVCCGSRNRFGTTTLVEISYWVISTTRPKNYHRTFCYSSRQISQGTVRHTTRQSLGCQATFTSSRSKCISVAQGGRIWASGKVAKIMKFISGSKRQWTRACLVDCFTRAQEGAMRCSLRQRFNTSMLCVGSLYERCFVADTVSDKVIVNPASLFSLMPDFY